MFVHIFVLITSPLTTACMKKVFFFSLHATKRGSHSFARSLLYIIQLLVLLAVGIMPTASAQNSDIIHGSVLSEQGAALAKVSVMVKETNQGTVTDSLGQFTINAKKGQ